MKQSGLIVMAVLGGTIALASPASAGMTIDVTYDSSVTANLTTGQVTQFENAFNAIAAEFDSAISNPITVNIVVSVGTINGATTPLPNGAVSGSFDTRTSMAGTSGTSFSNTKAALQGIGDTIGGDPTSGAAFYMPQAEVKALALSSIAYPTNQRYDGYIGFTNTISSFSFSGTPSASQYSFRPPPNTKSRKCWAARHT